MADPLEAVLAGILRQHQFKKKGSSWYRATDWSVAVVNLQKSNWGAQYYVNLGVSLTAFGGDRFPKEHHCHVRTRLDALRGDNEGIKLALDLEQSLTPDERNEILTSALIQYALPLLDQCATCGGFEQALKSGQLGSALIHKHVAELIRRSDTGGEGGGGTGTSEC